MMTATMKAATETTIIQIVLGLSGARLRGFSAAGCFGGLTLVTLRRSADESTSSVRKKPSYSLPQDAHTLLESGSVSPQIGHCINALLAATGTVALILY